MTALRNALDAFGEIETGTGTVVGLDFDGTLAPIVERPEQAALPAGTGKALERLAGRFPVVIVSGRGAADLRGRVGLDRVWYAGSHGFEITDGGGRPIPGNPAAEHEGLVAAIDGIEGSLRERFGETGGLLVERKRFGVAVHYRLRPSAEAEVSAAAEHLAATLPDLEVIHGKRVAEIRPAVEWNKGTAFLWTAGRLRPDGAGPLVYVGDDTTDEDAFRAVAGRGSGILVAEEPRTTAASHALRDPGEVRRFLERLAAG